MGKSEYFKTSNPLNVIINVLSGNVFPLSEGTEPLAWYSRIWIVIIWLIRITYFWTVLIGCLYFIDLPMEEIVKKTGAISVLSFEAFLPPIYLYSRKSELKRLIVKYNRALVDSDDLHRCIKETLKFYVTGLKVFVFASFGSTTVWGVAPLLYLLERNRFTYADFNVPAYFPGEPFHPGPFIFYTIYQIFGVSSMDFGKISGDTYIIHFIAVLTAQYKYLGEQIKLALSEDNKDEAAIIDALNRCIRHQAAIIDIAQSLTKFLALYVGISYVVCIFKFCFLAFGIVTFGGAQVEKLAYVFYGSGCVWQVFLLCASIHGLQDQSTSVTDEAFYANWHASSKRVKKIFCTIGLTNQMECRLSAWRIIDLVVPTLAAILSKSYSVCLLLLKVD